MPRLADFKEDEERRIKTHKDANKRTKSRKRPPKVAKSKLISGNDNNNNKEIADRLHLHLSLSVGPSIEHSRTGILYTSVKEDSVYRFKKQDKIIMSGRLWSSADAALEVVGRRHCYYGGW